MWKYKELQIVKITLKQTNKQGLPLFGLKTYSKVLMVNIERYWYKDLYTDHRNRTESPEIHIHMHCQLIFN